MKLVNDKYILIKAITLIITIIKNDNEQQKEIIMKRERGGGEERITYIHIIHMLINN